MLNVVSHTPVEIEKFSALQNSIGWVDAARRFVPEDKKLYSWWSYRAPDWDSADKGRRLDHIWVTKPLAGSLKKQATLREARGWEQPSDHVPVIVDLELSA
jgi:exodeoxyribonuclease-3